MFPNSSLAEGLVSITHAFKTVAADTQFTAAVPLANYDQLLFVFSTNDFADTSTINGGVATCDSDGTSNVVLIASKTLTERAAHDTNNDAKQFVIAVKSADLIAAGKDHVRGQLTGSGTGGGVHLLVLGTPKYGPAVQPVAVVETLK
jgi:hypothetical protein